ncbi:MAG TPA: hypothetical protein PLP19_07580 [bacterium]|nr:hypothetical protein [bacterium]HPN43332.1 hypothetical protein [bacterium]
MTDYIIRKETESQFIQPDLGACYSFAWKQLWKYFPELLLVTLVTFLFAVPLFSISFLQEINEVFAIYFSIVSMIYSFFVINPLEYGYSFVCLKAVRDEKTRIQDLFQVLGTYLQALLAVLLTGMIITAGIICCIIPGIILACKLAFVPFLVVDRRMDCIDAIKASWNMTNGHTTTIFLMMVLAIPIYIAGLICCGVGVIVAAIWVELAGAALYHAVVMTAGSAVSQPNQ